MSTAAVSPTPRTANALLPLRELVCRPHAIPGSPRVWQISPATPPMNMASARVPLATHDLVPLIEPGFLRLPSRPARYDSRERLLADMEAFIEKYVALPPEAVPICAAYAMLTWAADNFETVPYLRFLGTPQSGKSRALSTVGALCYRPVTFGAATTSAAIFRTIALTHGTLLIDEAIFSGPGRADVLAILCAGYQRRRPIARCTGENYGMQFFDAFGPKIIAGTEPFGDEALESRCITFATQPSTARVLHLPHEFHDEAHRLQNQLLRFRFNHAVTICPDETAAKIASGRAAQLAATLLPFNSHPRFRAALVAHLTEAAAENLMESDAAIVARVVIRRGAGTAGLGELASDARTAAQQLQHSGSPFVNRRVGDILRSLGFTVERSHGQRFVRVTPDRLKGLRDQFGAEPMPSPLPVMPVADLLDDDALVQ